MNRLDIQELCVHMSYPAITIISSCTKEGIQEKFDHLISLVSKKNPEIKHIQLHMHELLEQLVCPLDKTKIALFANKHIVRAYALPCNVADVESIDHYFILDPIATCINRKERYFVLECDPENLAFYEGHDETLIQVIYTKTGYQWKMAQPIGTLQKRICKALSEKACIEEVTIEFYQSLDAHLAEYVERDPQPLVIVGDEEHIQQFKKYSKHAPIVCAFVQDFTHVFKRVNGCYKQLYTQAIEKLNSASADVLIDKTANHQAITQAARQGAVEVLLVERSFHENGCEDIVSGELEKKDACSTTEINIDLIDALIESVKSKGGAVLLLPENSLANYNHVVAFTRF